MGLVAGGRARGGAGAAREIRDGLLAPVGARLCPRVSRRAPPFAPAAGRHRHRTSDLFTEFLVELEQRLCQLPPHARQCRTERAAVPPGRLYRISRLAIRRVRAIVVCRPDIADRNMARPRRTARPPARRLYAADLGDDARRQPVVARPCQLGGADLRRGDGAGCRLGIAARLAQAHRCVDCAASRGSRPALYRPRDAGRLRVRGAGPVRSAAPGAGLARVRRRESARNLPRIPD